MLTKFALELLSEVAEECERRHDSGDESDQKRVLFALAADEITTLMEVVAETGNSVVEELKRKAS